MSFQPCPDFTAGTPAYLRDLPEDDASRRASQAMVFLGLALIAWSVAFCAYRVTRVGLRALAVPQLLKAACQQDPVLRKHADAQHLKFWRITFRVMIPFGALMLSQRLITLQRDGRLREMLTGHACEHVLHDTLAGYFIIWCYGTLSCLVFTAFPKLLTHRTLYCWITLSYVWKQWHLMATHDLPWFMARSLGAVLLRVLLSTQCSNVAFVVLLNLAASTHHAWLTMRVFEVNNISYHDEPVLMFMSTLGLVLCLVLVNRVLLQLQIRSTLDAKSSRSVKSSIENVLLGVCDAVVHLRHDMTLEQTCPQLDGLLLRSPGLGAGLSDGRKSFFDYLYDDGDRERLQGLVQPEAEPGSLPHSLHVSMRDAHGAKIPVQLFHSQYLDAMDERFHTIGILDESGMEERRTPTPMQLAIEVERGPQSRQPSQGAISESSASSQGSAMAEVLPQVPDSAPGELAIWIDACAEGLPMVACTMPFFSQIGGPSLKKGTKLLSWVERRRRGEVTDEMQHCMNKLMDEPQWADPGFEVRLKPRHMAGRPVLARMAMSLPPDVRAAVEQDTLDDMAELLFKVTFTHLEVGSRPEPRAEPKAPPAVSAGPSAGTLQRREVGALLRL